MAGKMKMSKAIKVSLMASGLIMVALAAAVGYVLATFDSGRFRQQVVDSVREKTGRTLHIEGSIQLTVFPSIGMAVSGVSLSEPRSDQLFMRAREARASLGLLPLFSRRAEVDSVSLKGLAVTVVRSRQGRFNFEDLVGVGGARPAGGDSAPGSTGQTPPPGPVVDQRKDFAIRIAGVALEDATIDYTDETDGSRLVLSSLNLRAGAIADGVRSPVKLSFALQSRAPELDLAVDVETDLLGEREARRTSLEGFGLAVKGRALDITDLDATLKADVEARAGMAELSVSNLQVAARGRNRDADFQARLDIPRLSLAAEKLTGGQVTLEALVRRATQKLEARVVIPAIEASRGEFSTPPVDASLQMEQEGRTLQSTLSSPLSGHLEARTLELPGLKATLGLKDASIPGGSVDARIDGTARADLSRETVDMDLTAQVDESRLEGRVGLVRFQKPALTFDVKVDQLDADRYGARGEDSGRGVPPRGSEETSNKPAQGESAKPVDLSWLEGITLDGRLQVGQLKVANVRSSQVRGEVRAADGRLDVNPVLATFHGGSLGGAFSAQAAPVPSFSVKLKLDRVDMGPFLRDAARSDRMEGRGAIVIDVTTQGDTVAALKKGLNGNVAFHVTDGSIQGMDLAGMAREAKNKLRELKGRRKVSENRSEKTDFSDLRASFNIRNGVARNDDLIMKSPLLRVGGEGVIDLGSDRIDYLVKPTVVATSKGQGGHDLADLSGVTIPVRVEGPLKSPGYTIDYSGLALEYGKGILERAVDDMKGEGGRKLGDRLKGLLGR